MPACPQCQSPLGPSGLCPQCLLTTALSPLDSPTTDSFGSYEPLSILGEGGMGIIYLAEQTAPLRRLVALKTLKSAPGANARFEREKQSLALLNHPNIAAIHDAGISSEGTPWFAMEYVEGQPLTTWCDQQRLSIPARLALFDQLCLAVDHVHQRGVLHRDLKPANILVTIVNGEPLLKLIDFGLARLPSWQAAPPSPEIAGTPGYMSPEQASLPESALTPASDVYSLGVILHELLSGSLPTVPPQPTATTLAATARQTDSRSLNLLLHGDLLLILRHALHPDPLQRYPTAAHLAADLKRYLRHEPLEARRNDLSHRFSQFLLRHRTSILVGSLALSLACFAYLYFRSRTATTVTIDNILPFTAFEGHEANPTFSPDAKSVIFTWPGPNADNDDLYLLDSPGGVPRRLTTNPSPDLSPTWSPDGKSVAFLRGVAGQPARLMLLDLASGQERQLLRVRTWYSPSTRNLAWTPDSRNLVYLNESPAGKSIPFLLDLASGRSRALIPDPGPYEHLQPAVSPDGRTLAFTRDDLQRHDIWTLPLDSSYTPTGPPTLRAPGKFPTFLPNGDLLYQAWTGTRSRIWRLPRNEATPHPLDSLGDGFIEVSASPKNSIAVTRRIFDTDLYRLNLNGTPTPEPVFSSTNEETDPRLSPDASGLAFVSMRSGLRQLWFAALPAGTPRQLTFGDEVRRGPHWLPDGNTLRYGTRKGEDRRFWLMNAATGNSTFERSDIYIEHTTPNGQFIFFRKAIGNQDMLFRAPATRPDAARPVSNKPCFYSRFTPDGATLFCSDRPSGPATLWRIPTDLSSPPQPLLKSALASTFTTSRTGIYFFRKVQPARYTLHFQPFTPGPERLLWETSMRPNAHPTADPGDRFLILDLATREGSDIFTATLSPR